MSLTVQYIQIELYFPNILFYLHLYVEIILYLIIYKKNLSEHTYII